MLAFSYDLANLLVRASTPLAVIVVGFYIQRQLKRMDQRYWRTNFLVERRARTYDSMGESVNLIYSFFLYLGDWKTTSPAEVLEAKRNADREMAVSSPLFSRKLHEAYHRFIDQCFLQWSGKGQDAKLRTGFTSRAEWEGWQQEWEESFADASKKVPRESIHDCYVALLRAFALEIYGDPAARAEG